MSKSIAKETNILIICTVILLLIVSFFISTVSIEVENKSINAGQSENTLYPWRDYCG